MTLHGRDFLVDFHGFSLKNKKNKKTVKGAFLQKQAVESELLSVLYRMPDVSDKLEGMLRDKFADIIGQQFVNWHRAMPIPAHGINGPVSERARQLLANVLDPELDVHEGIRMMNEFTGPNQDPTGSQRSGAKRNSAAGAGSASKRLAGGGLGGVGELWEVVRGFKSPKTDNAVPEIKASKPKRARSPVTNASVSKRTRSAFVNDGGNTV